MNEKLTAYALNELPPDERAALEQQMTLDPALREEAEAMKVFCSLLKEQVGENAGPSAPEQEELTGDQRSQVLKAFLNTPRKVVRPPFWKRAEFISTAIAAGLALTLLVPSGVLIERRQDMPEAAARSNASEGITVTRAEPAPKELETTVKKKNRTLPAEVRSSSVAGKIELQDERFRDTTNAEGEDRKSLLGGVPAAPLALPTAPPAPITAPQLVTSSSGAGATNGAGTAEIKIEQSGKGQPMASTAPAPESAGSVAASPPPSGVAGHMLDALPPARTFKAREAQLAETPADLMERAKQAAAAVPAKPLAKAAPITSTSASTSGVTAAGAATAPAAPSSPDPLAAAPVMLDATPQLGTPAEGASARARQPAQPAAGAKAQPGVTITTGSNFYVGTDSTKADKDAGRTGDTTRFGRGLPPEVTEPLRQRESVSAGETYTPIYENPFMAVARSLSPPSPSMWTRPPTPMSAASSTAASARLRMRCGWRSSSIISPMPTKAPRMTGPSECRWTWPKPPGNPSTAWPASPSKAA
nr:hypothetical protein [Verrucomicrobium spinosum]